MKAYFTKQSTNSQTFVLTSLKWIVERFIEIIVIIDGADECSDREEFCELLESFIECENVKVLVASRPERDIETAPAFCGKPTINIDDAVKDDISTHVSWYIEKDRKLRRHRPDLKNDLLVKLIAKCDGMWVLSVTKIDELGSDGCSANLTISETLEASSI